MQQVQANSHTARMATGFEQVYRPTTSLYAQADCMLPCTATDRRRAMLAGLELVETCIGIRRPVLLSCQPSEEAVESSFLPAAYHTANFPQHIVRLCCMRRRLM